MYCSHHIGRMKLLTMNKPMIVRSFDEFAEQLGNFFSLRIPAFLCAFVRS